MTITMDDAQITTLEQVRKVLGSSEALTFKGASQEERYAWIEAVLDRFVKLRPHAPFLLCFSRRL